MEIIKLSEYSKCPAGKEDGENFATYYLLASICCQSDTVCIDLDDTYGISHAFLEGMLGSLVHYGPFPPTELAHRLIFKSDEDPSLMEEISSILNNMP